MEDWSYQEDFKQILIKRILGLKEGYRQNLALLGDESVGKTALVCRIISELDDKQIIPIFIRARKESCESFILRFCGTLLYAFLKSRSPETELNQDINYLIRSAENIIPKTISGIKTIQKNLEKRKYDELFIELLSILDLLFEESAKFTLVIFDEFHLLEKMPVKNLYREWAKKIILQKNTMYILISSAKFKSNQILLEKLSLLFGNFEKIEFNYLDLKKSECLIKEILSPLTIEKSNIDFIINFTCGHPFYIHLIASKLKDHLKIENANKNQSEYIVEVLGKLLFDKWGILNQKFISLLNNTIDNDKHSYDIIPLLLALSEGNTRIKELMQISHQPRKDINSKLQKLIEKDIVIRNGDFFKISDPMFLFWLRFIYQERLKSFDFSRNTQIKFFEGKIRQMLKEFILNSQKTITERLTDLFSLFNDEAIQIEKSKIRLSRFREIKPLNLEGRSLNFAIIARSSDFLWIVAIKTSGAIEEKDVLDFSQECKKYKTRSQHRILVTFDDIDTNARLLAKEQKILTWNVASLNSILDLYNKPRLLL
ncbi:MAG: hypothetical protein AB1755_00395 [Candidatus Omnitrophota bacterium]